MLVSDLTGAGAAALAAHAAIANPHNTTAADVGAYAIPEVDALLTDKTSLARTLALIDWHVHHRVDGVPATLWLLADPNVALPPGCTFTRATGNAAYVNALGNIAYASAGTLRHDFDPVTGEYRGWLIEGARTNNVIQSEDLNTTWSKTTVNVTVNAAGAPDGATTADKLYDDATAGAAHRLEQNLAGVGTNQTVAMSFFVKSAGQSRDLFAELIDNTTVNGSINIRINPDTGVVVATAAGGTGSVASSSIKAFGNGWYRVTLVGVPATGGASVTVRIGLHNRTSHVYAGDGTSGLYVWGVQLESGVSFATSYIPTTVAAATRNADVLTVATSGFDFNAVEGTLYINADIPNTANRSLAVLGTTSTLETVEVNVGGGYVQGIVVDGGVQQAVVDPGYQPAVNTAFWVAVAYKANDFAACVNGGVVATDNSGTVPAVDTLYLGANYIYSPNGGHIRHAVYFPRRLSNTALQTIPGL